MGFSLGHLVAYLDADTSSFEGKLNEASKSLQTIGKKMTDIGKKMTLFVTTPILVAGGAAIKLASDMEETTNKINVAFGQSSVAMMNWSNTSLTVMGMAQQSALDAAALFGDMATSMGLSQPAAADMSQSLTQLGADMASFKNVPVEQAMNALKGVFTGEAESLKGLGVVMNETSLKEFALTQGITKNIAEMTQAEKVTLRYAFVMDKTKNAQGDFERTSGGAANQTRMFGESIKQLGVQFGTIILPAFTAIITKVNGLIQKLSELSPVSKTIIIVVAGIAAAIGPLLLVLGVMATTVIPQLIKGFTLMRTAILAVNKAIMANPYTFAIAGLIALTVAIVALVAKNRELEDSTLDLSLGLQETQTEINKEQTAMNSLFKTAMESKEGTKERKKAIDELNSTYGDYLPSLLTEKSSLEDIKRAQSFANEELVKSIVLKRQQAVINDLLAKETETQQKILDKQMFGTAAQELGLTLMAKQLAALEKGSEAYQKLRNSIYETAGVMGASGSAVENLSNSFRRQADGLSQIENEYNNLKVSLLGVSTAADEGGGGGGGVLPVGKGRAKETPLITGTSRGTTGLQVDNSLSTLADETEAQESRLTTSWKNIHQYYGEFAENMRMAAEEFNTRAVELIKDGLNGITIGLAEGIGNMISGGGTMQDAFKSILYAVADFAAQFGRMMVGIGIAQLSLQSALKSMQPWAAIAAGVALVALSAVAKNFIAKGIGGAQGLATGGVVTSGGIFKVGERGEEYVNLPMGSAVTPAHKMQTNIGGNGNMELMADTIVRGDDLRILIRRANARNSRKGGM